MVTGTSGNRPRSQMSCEKIRNATLAAGVEFVDARPALRKAAVNAFVHGPRDWNHPNERGYRVLGALVAGRLEKRGPDVCDDTWASGE